MKRSEAERRIDERVTFCAEIRESLDFFENVDMEMWLPHVGVQIQLSLAHKRLSECVPIIQSALDQNALPVTIEEDDDDDIEGLF